MLQCWGAHSKGLFEPLKGLHLADSLRMEQFRNNGMRQIDGPCSGAVGLLEAPQ